MSSPSQSVNPDADLDSARIRFRRALTLLGMTLVIPGSAQLVAGNKWVGRAAMRAWLAAILGLIVLVALYFGWRSMAFHLMTNTRLLGLLRFALILAAAVWVGLLIDAWRLGDPLALRQRQRLTMFSLNSAVCIVASGALLFASHVVAVQKDFIEFMFGDGQVSNAVDGRYNVLLLGGDSGETRVGLRPDSITLASIDADTGRTVLFGLPRNMEHVPFPDGSVMARHFPNGFKWDPDYLNAINTWATDHPSLFPRDVQDPGIEATKEAVEGITGLQVNYYAMVNLYGFRSLVDAVGGITLQVHERVPIGGIGGKITGWIEPGKQHLDGYHALWYARSRASTDDYSRMARQKCVMNAMLHQLSPHTVLLHVESIATAGKQLMSTDIPASQLGTFIDLALKARSQPVATVSFVPPMIKTYDPDYGLIRAKVANAIARSEAADSGDGPTGHRHAGSDGGSTAGANVTANLAHAC
jgi:polyisoprenyl-teichoic acid--peptidoglycan teichoic acid transferase